MENKLIKDLFLGFIKIHLLHHAEKEKIYGQEFNKELKRHGYQISYGTLYPIFHKLEGKGFIKSERENVNGKIRRYYTITKSGKRILKEAKLQAKKLVEELHED